MKLPETTSPAKTASLGRRKIVLAAAMAALSLGGVVNVVSAPAALAAVSTAAAAGSVADAPITRSEVMTRSQSWIDEQVPYSQSGTHDNQYGSYRPDCSGYVSMAWHLGFSRYTGNLPDVMHSIARSELKPGDALFRHDASVQHIALFVRWNDAAHTSPVVREEYDYGHVAVERAWSVAYANTFASVRYNNIVDDGPTPPTYAKVTRYGFSNGAGVILAKDERDGSWATLNPDGRATQWVFDGDRIGAILDGNFLLKNGLYDSWHLMADGHDVKQIALNNGRIAFSNGAGIIFAKDQIDGAWHVLNPDGRATQWTLEGNRIGAILDGNFAMKENLDESWLPMATGGDVKQIALKGKRIAFSNSAGAILAKDEVYGTWHVLNPDGRATEWQLEGDNISAVLDGNFGMKEALDGPWITMAGGGDVKHVQNRDRMVQVG
jgi:cell wall-associated NlpC family hydrolase